MKTSLTLFFAFILVNTFPVLAQNFNLTGFYDGTITFEENTNYAFRLTWDIVATGNKFSGTAYIGGVNSKGHMTSEIEGTLDGDKITFVEKNVLSQDKKPTFERGFTKKRGILYIKSSGDNYYISGKAFSLLFKEQKILINFSKLPPNFVAASDSENPKKPDESEYLTVGEIDKTNKGKLSGKKIKFDNLIFDFNSVKLKNTEILDPLIDFLVKNPALALRVEGHTDNKGDASYNKELSEKRAKVVRDYLVAKGIDEKRISYQGFGSEKIISEKDEENRRVEIVFSE